jgi:hypothetical protein
MSSDSRPISRSLVKNAGPLLGAGAAARPRPAAAQSPALEPALSADFDDDRGGLVVDRIGKSFGGRRVVKDVSMTLRGPIFAIASPLYLNGIVYSIEMSGGLAAVDVEAKKLLYRRWLEG